MAQHLEAAYYTSIGEDAPAFLKESDNGRYTIYRFIEEKIAVSIAAFYALECAIGHLVHTRGGTPFEWLNKIAERATDAADSLLLRSFANAAWKAGQPFRGIDRITRDNFTSAYFLPEEEIKKDIDQVYAAALRLRKEMQDVAGGSVDVQLQKVNLLLQNESFALEMAQQLETAYYKDTHQPVPDFLKEGEDNAETRRSIKDDKIAANMAGFYALESGLNYLAVSRNNLPSDVLYSIVADSIIETDKELFERLANLTWKAGQPFRGLHRIKRATFISFDLLPQHEKEKDWVQIKAAAKKLQQTTQL